MMSPHPETSWHSIEYDTSIVPHVIRDCFWAIWKTPLHYESNNGALQNRRSEIVINIEHIFIEGSENYACQTLMPNIFTLRHILALGS